MRALRTQSPLVRVLSATCALVLVADVAGAVGVSVSGGSTKAGRLALRGGGKGELPGLGGTATGLGATSGGAESAGAAGGAAGGPGAAAGGPGGSRSAAGTTGGRGGSFANSPAGIAQARALCGTPSYNAALPASDNGVTPTSILVAFPYFDPTASFALTGTQESKPENQPDFIQAYVDCINAAGGIGGRKINAEIQVFNPLDENTMRALCIKFTQDDKVFAVLDSAGWFGQNQLCVTQENKTPLISGWSTTAVFTKEGAPYLWWTVASAETDIDNLLLWAKQRGKLTTASRIGVVSTDRPYDQVAYKHMLAALGEAGLPLTDAETFTWDRSQAEAQATIAVNKMQAKHVDVLLPLLPFDSFAFWLQAAENQKFYPRYLLSDFEQELVIASALLGSPYPKSLEHAQGPTYAHLGEPDDAPKFPPHYDATEARCEAIWHREHPGSNLSVAGVNMRWCDSINLFVEAARRAGPNLTRPRWAQEMATIQNFGGAMTPILSYGPGRYEGPTQMRIVDTLTSDCPAYTNGTPCDVILEDYAPIRHF